MLGPLQPIPPTRRTRPIRIGIPARGRTRSQHRLTRQHLRQRLLYRLLIINRRRLGRLDIIHSRMQRKLMRAHPAIPSTPHKHLTHAKGENSNRFTCAIPPRVSNPGVRTFLTIAATANNLHHPVILSTNLPTTQSNGAVDGTRQRTTIQTPTQRIQTRTSTTKHTLLDLRPSNHRLGHARTRRLLRTRPLPPHQYTPTTGDRPIQLQNHPPHMQQQQIQQGTPPTTRHTLTKLLPKPLAHKQRVGAAKSQKTTKDAHTPRSVGIPPPV